MCYLLFEILFLTVPKLSFKTIFKILNTKICTSIIFLSIRMQHYTQSHVTVIRNILELIQLFFVSLQCVCCEMDLSVFIYM